MITEKDFGQLQSDAISMREYPQLHGVAITTQEGVKKYKNNPLYIIRFITRPGLKNHIPIALSKNESESMPANTDVLIHIQSETGERITELVFENFREQILSMH